MSDGRSSGRFIEMESKIAFAEDAIAQLDALVIDLHRRIEALEADNRRLAAQLEEGQSPIQDEPPPHY